jgi:hypothetical protein
MTMFLKERQEYAVIVQAQAQRRGTGAHIVCYSLLSHAKSTRLVTSVNYQ